MEKIKVHLPSNPIYLPTLRLAAASVANTMGLDVDQLEDIKVIVSEIFTYLLPYNERIKVKFEVSDQGLKIVFKKNDSDKHESFSDSDFELKRQILLALSDELEVEEDKITVILNK